MLSFMIQTMIEYPNMSVAAQMYLKKCIINLQQTIK